MGAATPKARWSTAGSASRRSRKTASPSAIRAAGSCSASPANGRTSARPSDRGRPGAQAVLTPALIGVVSLAGRRWGPGVSGWLVGFPLTSGPVAFFLALDHGVRFAAAAAVGSMAGAGAQAVFCVLYGRLARRGRWGWALGAGTLGFAVATVILQTVDLSLAWLVPIVFGALPAALAFMPTEVRAAGRRGAGAPPAEARRQIKDSQ